MGRKILLFLGRIFWNLTRVEVVGGLKHILRAGAAIIVVNHLGRFEVPFVYTIANRHDLTGLVVDKHRKLPLMPLIFC